MWTNAGVHAACLSELLRAKLLRGRQEDFGGREELHVGQFGHYPHAFKLALFPATSGSEGQEILVVKVLLYFVKVGLERYRTIEGQIVRFRSSLFREPAEIRLGVENAEVATTEMVAARIIDRPYVDVFFLGAFDGALQVGIHRIKTAAKIIDSGGNHDDGGAMIAGGRGPTFEPILQGQIRTGKRAALPANRNAQSLSG